MLSGGEGGDAAPSAARWDLIASTSRLALHEGQPAEAARHIEEALPDETDADRRLLLQLARAAYLGMAERVRVAASMTPRSKTWKWTAPPEAAAWPRDDTLAQAVSGLLDAADLPAQDRFLLAAAFWDTRIWERDVPALHALEPLMVRVILDALPPQAGPEGLLWLDVDIEERISFPLVEVPLNEAELELDFEERVLRGAVEIWGKPGLDILADHLATICEYRGDLEQAAEYAIASLEAELERGQDTAGSQADRIIRYWKAGGVLDERLAALQADEGSMSPAARGLVLGNALWTTGRMDEATEAYALHLRSGGRVPMAIERLASGLDPDIDGAQELLDHIVAGLQDLPDESLTVVLDGVIQAMGSLGGSGQAADTLAASWQEGRSGTGEMLVLWRLDRREGVLSGSDRAALAEQLAGSLPESRTLVRFLVDAAAWDAALTQARSILDLEMHRQTRPMARADLTQDAWGSVLQLDDLLDTVLHAWDALDRSEDEIASIRSRLLAGGQDPVDAALFWKAYERGDVEPMVCIGVLETLLGGLTDAKARSAVANLVGEAYAGIGQYDRLTALARKAWNDADAPLDGPFAGPVEEQDRLADVFVADDEAAARFLEDVQRQLEQSPDDEFIRVLRVLVLQRMHRPPMTQAEDLRWVLEHHPDNPWALEALDRAMREGLGE